MEPRFRTHRRSHRQLEAECFEESRESVNI
jgi:hypothetical protein